MVNKTVKMELPNVDVDDDDSAENGVFEFESYTLEQRIRTGFIVGSDRGDLRQIITDKVADGTVHGTSQYRDFHVNEGSGNRLFVLSFEAVDGHTDPTWGDTKEPQGTVANATGQGPLERMQVLEHYLASLSEDSRNPITLRLGGYRSGGLFDSASLSTDSLKVVLENPSLTYNPRDEPSAFSGELTFIETVSSNEIISSAEAIARDAT